MADKGGPANDEAAPAQPTVGTPPESLRTLPVDEYRDWVHDQVSHKMYRRVGAIASVIGIGGVVLLGALGMRLITAETETARRSLEEDLRRQLEVERSEFEERTETLIGKEVGSILLHEADLRQILRETAVEEAKGIADEIVQEELDKPGGLESALFRNLRPVVRGERGAAIPVREQALRLMLIFALDQNDLNLELFNLLVSNRAEDDLLRKIALSAYTPFNEVAKRREVLDALLAKSSEDLRAATDDDWAKAYTDFFARFAHSSDVEYFGTWVEKNVDSSVAPTVISALAASTNNDAVRELIRLAQAEDQGVARMGWLGLNVLSRTEK